MKLLKDLSITANNRKSWFDARRSTYVDGLLEPGRDFVEALGQRLQELSKHVNFDPRVGGSIMRINRDTRFKKDKRPYKDHLDFWFWQGIGKGSDDPGYYASLSAERVVLGAGTHWLHDGDVLERYRAAIADPKRGAALGRILARMRAAGPYEIAGDHYKRVPKPYPADHPRADLLRHHALYGYVELRPVPTEIHSDAFVDLCVGHYAALAPLEQWVYAVISGA